MSKLKRDLFADIIGEPKESYTFEFDEKHLAPVEKKYIGELKTRMVISIILCAVCAVIGIAAESPVILGLGLGALAVEAAVYGKTISASKKNYTRVREVYSKKMLFEYTLYSDCLIAHIYSYNAERTVKFELYEIKSVYTLADTVIFEADGQLFPLKKDELAENSYFLMRCAKK